MHDKTTLIIVTLLLALCGFNYWRFDSERSDLGDCNTNLTTSHNNEVTLKTDLDTCNASVSNIGKNCTVKDAISTNGANNALKMPLPAGHGPNVMNQFEHKVFP